MNTNKPLALVTGGASGMGLATVERLARDGFAVVLIDRSEELAVREARRLQEAGLDVEARVLDLTDEAAVRSQVQSLPPVAQSEPAVQALVVRALVQTLARGRRNSSRPLPQRRREPPRSPSLLFAMAGTSRSRAIRAPCAPAPRSW